MIWEYKVVQADTGASSTIQYTRQLNSLGEQGWEMCAETAAEFLVFKRPKLENSLEEEIAKLKKENARLLSEIKEPRCNSCNSILGDNWCADCAGKADRERFEHYKRTGQDLFAKVVCNICSDPNCAEPNQKH